MQKVTEPELLPLVVPNMLAALTERSRTLAAVGKLCCVGDLRAAWRNRCNNFDIRTFAHSLLHKLKAGFQLLKPCPLLLDFRSSHA